MFGTFLMPTPFWADICWLRVCVLCIMCIMVYHIILCLPKFHSYTCVYQVGTTNTDEHMKHTLVNVCVHKFVGCFLLQKNGFLLTVIAILKCHVISLPLVTLRMFSAVAQHTLHWMTRKKRLWFYEFSLTVITNIIYLHLKLHTKPLTCFKVYTVVFTRLCTVFTVVILEKSGFFTLVPLFTYSVFTLFQILFGFVKGATRYIERETRLCLEIWWKMSQLQF